ncbi:PSPA7_2676 family Cys-rich small protein [Pseudomonas sp. NPDC089392]
MHFFCLLRGCQWHVMPDGEIAGLKCQCCERCGAWRYCQLEPA